MRDPRVDEYARLLVERSVDVRPGWQVLVRGTPLARPIIESLLEQIARRGAYPILQMTFELIGGPFAREAPVELVREPAPLQRRIWEEVDAIISIWGPENTREGADLSEERQAAIQQMVAPMRERTMAMEIPWVVAEYPALSTAQEAGMTLAEYEAFIFGAVLLDGLRDVPAGYRLLPAHPWQYELLREHPALRAAMERHEVLDLGPGGPPFTPTASVRTLHGAGAFLKFSLNVRITNCLRKNAAYELTGAVALTRLLEPVLAELAARYPDAAMLREPAYRTLALPDAQGGVDLALFEGFGLIVREDLAPRLRPGVTPLLAAAVADEYPTSSAHISRLLPGAGEQELLD